MIPTIICLTLVALVSSCTGQFGPGSRPPPPPPFGIPPPPPPFGGPGSHPFGPPPPPFGGPGGFPPPPPPFGPWPPAPFNSTCPYTTPQQNKKLVIDFYQAVFGNLDFSVIDKYLPENFIEHNPNEKDGRDEFKKNIPLLLSATPKGSLEIRQSAADGNLVWLHSKLPIQGKDYALADIFRVECGKIVEHWDVVHEMTPSTVNPHPYF